jgi:hypothetical protein
VLHDAIVGDVTRAHIELLTRAEDLLRSGAKKLSEGMAIVGPQDAAAVAGSLERPIVLLRNLGGLCRESLKPKSWFASASLKFVVVFLVTAVVLVAAVTSTNVGDKLGGGILTAYVLLMSFVTGLVGGFGFEALRFLPFAQLLSKSRPAPPKPSSEGVDR